MQKSTPTGQQQGTDLESVIGIDVGGTKTKACLVKVATGEVLAEATEPTPCAEGGAAVLHLVDDLARRMEAESAKRGQTAQVLGLDLPELVTLDGSPASAWNFDWQDLDFRTPFSRFDPLRLDSDVRAAAFAEDWIGAGRGFDNFLYFTLSTGLSQSLVINGRPYVGARGFSIHFGSSELVLYDGGARDLFAAETTDPLAAQIVSTSLLSFASYLGQLINSFDPGAVVLGGGIGGQPGITARIGEATRPFIFANAARDLPILPAELGDQACAIGAAVLAVDANGHQFSR